MDSSVLSSDVHGHGDSNDVSNNISNNVSNDVQESESNDGHESMICEPEISTMNANNRCWTPSRLREMEGDSRFKLCAWIRGFRGPGHHHKVYRRVYVDDLYTSWVKCLICSDYVKYDMRTGECLRRFFRLSVLFLRILEFLSFLSFFPNFSELFPSKF